MDGKVVVTVMDADKTGIVTGICEAEWTGYKYNWYITDNFWKWNICDDNAHWSKKQPEKYRRYTEWV